MSNESPNPNHAPSRKKVFFPRGYQFRYTALVAGSLLVLLIFACFHALFVVQTALAPEVYETVKEPLEASTYRLVLVGAIHIAVVTFGAVFLSHRMVGPTSRIESEIRRMAEGEKPVEPLQIREGDDFEHLIEAINKLIRKFKSK